MTIISILVASAGAFIWSSLYYSPLLVGKAWQKAAGLKKEDMSHMTPLKLARMFGISFVLYFVQFFIFGFILMYLGVTVYSSAIIVAILMGVFLESSSIIKGMYEQKKFTLTLINMGDTFAKLILGACIIIAMM